MRLWDYRLIPYIPKGQLLSQKRECDLIWKDIARGKKTNHILINYIWEYEDYLKELSIYYRFLKDEFKRRGFNFRDNKYSYQWIDEFAYPTLTHPFKNHHNNDYLTICYYNLKEKFMRGQKDFSKEEYEALSEFVLMQQSQEFVKFRWEE